MSIVVQYSIHFMVPCIQTLLLNSTLFCGGDSAPAYFTYHVVAIQPRHTITLFCTVEILWSIFILSTILYLFINDWVVIVFMPSLNKFGPFPCIWMPSTFVLLFLVSLEFSSANFRAYFIYVKYVFCIILYYILEYSLGT